MGGKHRKGIWTVIFVLAFNLSPLLSQNVFILTKNVNYFSPGLADDHFNNALVHFNSGNTKSAIEEYEKSIFYHPGHTASLSLNLRNLSN